MMNDKLELHQQMDRFGELMGRAAVMGSLKEDWRRLTDIDKIGEYWDQIGFDLWLEFVVNTAKEMRLRNIKSI